MTYNLNAIQDAAELLGIEAVIDLADGDGAYALISGPVTVGPATIVGLGDPLGASGNFHLSTPGGQGDPPHKVALDGMDAEEIALLMADHLGLVMACGTCGHRYADNTPAGRCPREADHSVVEPQPAATPYVILYGNPVDGLKVIGPLPDVDAAVAYGDDELDNVDWCVAPLEASGKEPQQPRRPKTVDMTSGSFIQGITVNLASLNPTYRRASVAGHLANLAEALDLPTPVSVTMIDGTIWVAQAMTVDAQNGELWLAMGVDLLIALDQVASITLSAQRVR